MTETLGLDGVQNYSRSRALNKGPISLERINMYLSS